MLQKKSGILVETARAVWDGFFRPIGFSKWLRLIFMDALVWGESRKNKLLATEDLSMWTITKTSLQRMQQKPVSEEECFLGACFVLEILKLKEMVVWGIWPANVIAEWIGLRTCF